MIPGYKKECGHETTDQRRKRHLAELAFIMGMGTKNDKNNKNKKGDKNE